MRIGLFPVVVVMSLGLASYATPADGQDVLKRKITLSADQEEMKVILRRISKKAEIKFVYISTKIEDRKKVSVFADNEELGAVLDRLLSPFSIRYKVVDDQIILKHCTPAGNIIDSTRDVTEEIQLQKPITGKVTDSTGKGIANVSITIRGTNRGSSTNSSGLFIIDADPDDVLDFSIVGYKTVSLTVGGNSSIEIKMLVEAVQSEEVIVTAYGKKQRKEAIVGSVTSVNAKELKVPSSNLTTAFAGRMAGVIAYQRTGEPGADNATFFIRGVTTFGNGSGNPLILIDNIELTSTDLARLQPDDIESFSILKDASATALYGARGANGVIFVTTKQGKEGKVKINVRLENSISSPTKKIDVADPITHMRLYTEAQLTRDPLSLLAYSQNKMDHTIAGDNSYVYPATDWFDLMFKERTSNQRGNISLTGGGKVAQYYVAGTYNIDHGILNVDERNNFNSNVKLNSYQLRSNINIQLSQKTELIIRMFGTFDDYRGPIDGGSGLYQKALRTSPSLFAPYYLADSANIAAQHILFGNYRSGSLFYMNPYADMLRGYKDYSQSRMLAQFELNQNLSGITQGLNLRAMFSTNRYSFFDVSRAYGPYYYNVGIYDKAKDNYKLSWLNETITDQNDPNYAHEDIRGLSGTRNLSTNLYAQANLEYSRLFNDRHNVGATLVGTIQQTVFTTDRLDVQSSLPSRNIGLSGRASYSFDNRYFAEFNFGYNGSERFYKDKQFGFFPTIGAGWVISNENFWKSNFINRLKIRGSYGLVGNDAIGRSEDRFFYLSSVNLDDASRSASFGFDNSYSRNGISISRYPNTAITWEKSYQANLAIEMRLLNKFNIVAEVYQQKRNNILMTRSSLPSTMGLSTITQANVGEAKSKGVDLSLDYSQDFGKNLWVTARGSFTYARGEFSKYEEPEYADKYLSHVGQSINQTWGYIAERLFIDEKDVQSSPRQNFGLYQAGDLKYRDLNGDGQITSLDMTPIGYPTAPEITYGFGFSLGYKKFDFSIFMQGLARESFWINPWSTAPFVNYDDPGYRINGGRIGENALLQAYADNHWSEERRDIYALWPRLSVTPIENNNQISTWFMRDGSFLRVKSIEAGYTLPRKLLEKYKITNLRIYFSGTNLFTFSQFKLWDPEMGGNGLAYPIQKVMNAGVNLNF